MNYTTSALAKSFKVSRETIRQWSIHFERHLSEGATVEDGKHRRYSDDDLEVLALVAEMRDNNAQWDEIHIALDAGQRGSVPENPRALITQTHSAQIKQLESEIVALGEQINQWRDMANQRVGENNLLRQQLADRSAEIDRLKRKIWELESKSDNKD